MKKYALLLLLAAAPVFAEDLTNEDALEDARVMKVELLLYPDMTRGEGDLREWHELVRNLTELVSRRNVDTQSLDSLYQVLAAAVNTKENAVRGHLRLTRGNGKCPEDVCGPDCECLTKYNGICPCGLEEN